MERLDKLVSRLCSVSRKQAKQMIRQGEVLYNKSSSFAEQQVDAAVDSVSVNGRELAAEGFCYLMLHKPSGILSAARDPKQKTVVDLIPKPLQRKGLFPAGRLDKDTSGFVLLTDDGTFAHRLLAPKNQIYKTYRAQLRDPLSPDWVSILENGITLQDDTQCLPTQIRVLENRWVEIRICEGKYHQVKRMVAACGNHVEQLIRVKIGNLALDPDLPQGMCRPLKKEELDLLLQETP